MSDSQSLPFSRVLHYITKDYFGGLTHLLSDVVIDRHFYPLVLIANSGNGYTQKDLGEALEVDKVTMSRMIDYLVEKGVIERCIHKEDRRTVTLKVTPKGREILPRITAAFETLNNQSFRGVDHSDYETFMRVAMHIRDNMKEIPKDQVMFDYKKLMQSKK
jgi:DNA-binding MarR family transcriptional regulator